MCAKPATKITAKKGLTVLFFDMGEVDALDNVVRSVCQATKHPHNPVLQPGDYDAWDSAQAAPWSIRTVMYDEDEGLFKCWYTGTDIAVRAKWFCGYAVSDDGVVWRKPNLGVYEFEGNKRNNIINNVSSHPNDKQVSKALIEHMFWRYPAIATS